MYRDPLPSPAPGRSLAPAFFLALLALLALTLPPTATAAAGDEPWLAGAFEAEPAELLAAAQAVTPPPDSDVLVLFRDLEYRFDEDGRRSYRQRLVYRLLTPAGVEGWSTVGTDWAPWHQEEPEIRARVITADGVVEELDPATLNDSPTAETSPDVFDDRLIRQAPLPALRVGSVVEEVVTVRDREPFFAAGTAGVVYLAFFQPVHHGRLTLEAATSLPLRYRVRGMPGLEPRTEVDGDRVRLTFDYRDLPAAEVPDPGLPPEVARFPSVGWSTGRDWASVAGAYSGVVDRQLEGAELGPLLAKAGGAESDAERIDELLATVRDAVRYTGLELGASSLVPAPPGEVLKRHFGDCKDQATLLVGLLRAEGIPAYTALLRADFGEDVEPELPGVGTFNHAIVYVPGARPIWIDPTNPHARAGELPLADQGRWALVAAPSTTALVRTPATDSIDNRVVETREVSLADYGHGRVVETTEYHGYFEQRQRSIAAESSEEDSEEGYLDYVRSEYLADRVEAVEQTPSDDLSQPFTLRIEAAGAERAGTDLDEAAVGIPVSALLREMGSFFLEQDEDDAGEDDADDGDAEEEPRTADFVFPLPHVVEWRYRITPPAGMVPRELPEDAVDELGTARLSRSYREEGGVVHADFRFDSGFRRITPEQLEETRRAVRELAEGELVLISFDHLAAVHLAAGRSREAIAELRRLADADPELAIHRVRLSRGLLAVGLGEEARRQARRATELEPEAAIAHWALGFALSHDSIGRLRQPGYDLEGAVAAFARAAELDPEDPLMRAELAITLDFDADGRRYGDGADLDRAIEEYRRWREDFDSPNLDENLLGSLFWARRWDDLEDFAGERPEGIERQLWLAVARGAREGAPAVMRQAASSGLDRNEQSTLVATTAQHLLLAREYPTAAEVLRRSAAGAANPAATLAQADLIGEVRRIEELELPDDDPASVVRRLFALIAHPAPDPAELTAIFHPDLLDQDPEASDLDLLKREVRRGMGEAGGMPLRTAMEVGLAAMSFPVEGDDATGYRVKVESNVPGYDFESDAFVTRVGDGYRIRAFEDDFGDVGREVLSRLDAGETEAAGQWLDWARERLPVRESDDPLAGHPFSHLWPAGDDPTPEAMRRASAALIATSAEAAAALPILESAAAESEGEESRWLRVALFGARMTTEDEAGAAEVAASLVRDEPGSERAFRALTTALRFGERYDELRRRAAARLEERPEDPEALFALASSAIRGGDAEEAGRWFRRLEEVEGKVNGTYLNDWAWALLFEEPVPEEAVEVAQRAAATTDYASPAVLHTLAAAYAAFDRPLEAYRVLLQAMTLRQDPEPTPVDWYVLGRIAESYGYPEVAREGYRRAEPEDDAGQDDRYATVELARRRLAGLGR